MERIVIPGLADAEQADLDYLVAQLTAKLPRNRMRAAYYDGRHAVKDIGMTLPPAFRRLGTVLGWPAKAVDTLAQRCNLEGFVLPGGDPADFGVDALWESNSLASEAPQATISALIHGVAWVVTTKGQPGEPAALITVRDAMTGTGRWDARRRDLAVFLSIVDVDDRGRPTNLVLYYPTGHVQATREPRSTRWSIDRVEHQLGRVPVERLVYKPRVARPFGSSRISRPVMSITDLAMRTIIRSEVTAELYSVPQRIILGADESSFKNADGTTKAAWQVVFGRVWAHGRDGEGNVPQVEQLAQASQQPHVDQLKELVYQFAGETSIPPSSLGIITQNPPSAEGYYASREDLISLAEATTTDMSAAWARAMTTAVGFTNKELVPGLAKLRAKWRNPTYTSKAAASDAALKLVTVFPWMADSDTALELLGFDAITVERLLADKRRLQARAALAALAASPAAVAGEDASLVDRITGFGTLVRSGVTPESAASQVGLQGLDFLPGALPVTVRQETSGGV